MTLKTLQKLDKDLTYLMREATLEEVLAFLGIQYFDNNHKLGDELKFVYEFEDTYMLAIEVSITNKEMKFWGNIRDSKHRLIEHSFWVWLDQHYSLLFLRLIYLLNKRYRSYSPYAYKINIQGEWFDLEVNTSLLDTLDSFQLSLLSDSDLEKLYS
jgi:hypothetical protein